MSERQASLKVAGNPQFIRNIRKGASASPRGENILKLARVLQVILALCRRLNGDGVLDLPLLLEHLYLLASAAPHTPATPQSALQLAGRAELQKIVDGLEAIASEADDEDPV